MVGVQLGVEGLQGLNIIGLAPLAGLLSAFANSGSYHRCSPAMGSPRETQWRGLGADEGERGNRCAGSHGDTLHPRPRHHQTSGSAGSGHTPVPLALSGAYLATQFAVLTIAHQGSGTYLHYFYLFLNRRDVFYSVVKVVVFAVLVTVIHTYYGMTGSGGPEGVGLAVGRAVRTSTVVIAISDMLMTLLFWGVSVPVKVTG